MSTSSRVPLSSLDVRIGERYELQLADQDAPILTTFDKEMNDGTYRFCREGTGRDIYIAFDVFEAMRCSGLANRIVDQAARRNARSKAPEVPPEAGMDPNELSITLRERKRRLAAAWRLQKARTLRYYTIAYDNSPAGRGRVGVSRLIRQHRDEAFRLGFDWIPSASTVLRAVDECGTPGSRPLSAFLHLDPGLAKQKRWSPDVLDAAKEASAFYWSKATVRIEDAIVRFGKRILERDELRRAMGISPNEVPSNETLRVWIRSDECWETYKTKYDKKAADRRFRGRGTMPEASRPLEYVLVDHTQIDAWAVLLNDDGDPILVERPWLTSAVDLFSRMVLGLVLTFEPPSVYSVLECLKQVVRRKQFLLDQYGYHKGATDGWGKPLHILVDNGFEFTGLSLQVCCEAADIDIEWSPVGTPQYKAVVERLFGTFNEHVWHRLGYETPTKPSPTASNVHTKSFLEAALWNAVVTIYHVEVHSALNMAPAEKWRKGLANKERWTVDDVTALDKVLGTVSRCMLTAEGIHLDGQRFHDQETTSELLNALLRSGQVNKQRRGKQTGSVYVLVTKNPADASYVQVWDFSAKSSVRLPNTQPTFTAGLSWANLKHLKAFVETRNLAFHSEEDRIRARAAHIAFLQSTAPMMKTIGEARRARAARIIDAETKLVDGTSVNFVTRSDLESGKPLGEVSADPIPTPAPIGVPPEKLRVRGGSRNAAGRRRAKSERQAVAAFEEILSQRLGEAKPEKQAKRPSAPRQSEGVADRLLSLKEELD